MKITVSHSTLYRYDFPVYLEPHVFRLRPRMTNAQQLLDFDIQIAPLPAGTTECLDQDGNLALNAWFGTATRDLSVTSRFTVEMLRQNPFDYVLTGESLNLPLWYAEPLCAALMPYRQDAHVAESVKQFAKSAAAGAQWNTLLFLLALSRQIFQICRQSIRPYGSPWPSDQTLRLQEGSCRDLAVLFCDACRVMGIAARFVSGYECASAGSQDPYMHAWAEVYLPAIGWRGYDPARGLAVSNGHVAVAAGFDFDLAAPVAGWYSGRSRSRMEASLYLQVDDVS
ncbi:MAG: transglutaminase family protein [Acidobacteria bacterium]|nr:transglutaminase family protein [Acidobacteriota bacterium]